VRLYSSALSPFGRKVRACAVARDIAAQVTVLPAMPAADPAELLAANPLGKIPALVTVDGIAIYDSRVICEYLDTVGDAAPMFPEHGRARWRALIQQGLADGIMDAAVLRRGESAQPDVRPATMDRQRAKVARGLAALEGDPPHQIVDIGVIAVACALGYLDLRFAHEPWRAAHPRLAAWFAEIAAHPWFAQTAAAA